jgi:hypothetical protein
MICGKELGLEFNDYSAILAIPDHAEIPAFDKEGGPHYQDHFFEKQAVTFSRLIAFYRIDGG